MTNNFNEETSLKAENIACFMVAIAVLISVVNVFSEWNYIKSRILLGRHWLRIYLSFMILVDISSKFKSTNMNTLLHA